jgi:hypothetical protein
MKRIVFLLLAVATLAAAVDEPHARVRSSRSTRCGLEMCWRFLSKMATLLIAWMGLCF